MSPSGKAVQIVMGLYHGLGHPERYCADHQLLERRGRTRTASCPMVLGPCCCYTTGAHREPRFPLRLHVYTPAQIAGCGNLHRIVRIELHLRLHQPASEVKLGKQGKRVPDGIREFIANTNANAPGLTNQQIADRVAEVYGDDSRPDRSTIGRIRKGAEPKYDLFVKTPRQPGARWG